MAGEMAAKAAAPWVLALALLHAVAFMRRKRRARADAFAEMMRVEGDEGDA